MEQEILSIKLEIFESYNNNSISHEEMILLLESLVDVQDELGYIDEGFKDSVKTIANSTKKNVADAMDKVGKSKFATAYNKGMNDRATAVAKVIVKDPTKKGTQTVEPHVYDKYKKDIQTWRTRYKAAEILATGIIAVGPIDTVLKAATFGAMARSNDPVDKSAQEMVNKIKDKYNDIKKKVANKVLTKPQLDAEISNLDRNTTALAKLVDKIRGNKNKPLTESVSMEIYNKLDDHVLDSNGCLTESGMEILLDIIDDDDIATENALEIFDHYLDK